MLAGRVAGLEPAGDAGAVAMVELVGGDRIAASITRWAAEELGLAPGREVVALVKTVALAGVGTDQVVRQPD